MLLDLWERVMSLTTDHRWPLNPSILSLKIPSKTESKFLSREKWHHVTEERKKQIMEFQQGFFLLENFVIQHEGGRPQQILSRILSEEIADQESVWAIATENGDPVRGGNKVNQGDLCALER
jgi:hypothetical protein